jgi:hypothetical protein
VTVQITDFKNRKEKRAHDAKYGSRRATGDEVLDTFLFDLRRGITVLTAKTSKPYEDREEQIRDEAKLQVVGDLHKVLSLMRKASITELKR